MEELARLERLRDAVREVQAGHGVVRDLGVEPDHLGMIQRVDQRQCVPDRREEDVAAGLVRLRLQRELVVVALRDGVFTEEVERVAEPLHRLLRILRGVGLRALSAAPEDVRRRAELLAEVHRAHGLLQRVPANFRVDARERAVAENGVAEQIGRGHRHLHTRGVERRLELLHDPVALRRGGIARDEIVVVEVDAIRPQLAELVDDLDGADDRTRRVAERVAAGVAHRPQPEGEMVLRARSVGVLRR